MTANVFHLEDRRPADANRTQRITASQGWEHIVDIEEGADLDQTADYLGISKSALMTITRTYGDELREVGYLAGVGVRSAMSRRAILHVAMLVRPNTSDVAKELRRQMGVWIDKKPHPNDVAHIQRCRAALEKVMEVIVDVRDIAPEDLWKSLGKVDRWTLQALVMALATMVDDEATYGDLTTYLTEISRITRWDKKNANPGHGLSKLAQPKKKETQ